MLRRRLLARGTSAATTWWSSASMLACHIVSQIQTSQASLRTTSRITAHLTGCQCTTHDHAHACTQSTFLCIRVSSLPTSIVATAARLRNRACTTPLGQRFSESGGVGVAWEVKTCHRPSSPPTLRLPSCPIHSIPTALTARSL